MSSSLGALGDQDDGPRIHHLLRRYTGGVFDWEEAGYLVEGEMVK